MAFPRPRARHTNPKPGHHGATSGREKPKRSRGAPSVHTRFRGHASLADVSDACDDTSYKSLTSSSPLCPYFLSTTIDHWHRVFTESDSDSPSARRFDRPPVVNDACAQLPVTSGNPAQRGLSTTLEASVASPARAADLGHRSLGVSKGPG